MFLPASFFTSAFADDLLQETEWQQVSSSLQESSQYSVRPQPSSNLDGLGLSSDFQLIHSPITKLLGILSNLQITIVVTFMFLVYLSSQARSKYLSLVSPSLTFTI